MTNSKYQLHSRDSDELRGGMTWGVQHKGEAKLWHAFEVDAVQDSHTHTDSKTMDMSRTESVFDATF